MPEREKGLNANMDENVVYPEVPLLTDRRAEEELNRGRIYRLNDRFFKFLFGGPERKHLFLDLVNALVFPDGSAGFTGFEYTNTELSAKREDGKNAYLDVVAKMADGSQVRRSRLRRSIDLHFCPAFSSSIARQLMKQLMKPLSSKTQIIDLLSRL